MAAKFRIKIEQGATYRPDPFILRDKSTQAVLDLTGCTARMQIRNKVSSPDILCELTTGNGGIVINGGSIALFISADDTAEFNFKLGVYDLELIYPNADVVRLLEGQVSVSYEVTR